MNEMKKKASAMQKSDLDEKRKFGIYNLIKSQTNYTENEIKEKMKKWNNDYIKVIKEYLNPDFEKKKEIVQKTTNQMMMTEIRHFLDNIKS
jgi:hypothetical protein